MQNGIDMDSLAIVGMACRWPGANTPSAFWDLLRRQHSAQSKVPASRFNIDSYYHPDPKRPATVHCDGGYFLQDDPREFDPTFFGIGSKDAMEMDPQQRKLLETVYEAMEASGTTMEDISGALTGCFVGNFTSDYQKMSVEQLEDTTVYQATGTGVTLLSNRVSYCFNLKGPSLTLDTACSSALYALHLACTSIKNGECTSAIVGGTNLILNLPHHISTAKLGVLSPTSTCHTFDEAADGYGRADGIGAVIIKPLRDAIRDGNPVRAIIKATAFNANGRSGGLTTPSVEGQEALMKHAYRTSGLLPIDTGYFECHGTGTPVGDPIEVEAVGNVFSATRNVDKNPLYIGSVKTNIGHGEASSGLAGLMKAVLALENKVIPAVVGLKKLNAKIDFRGAGVEVVTKNTPFPPTTFDANVRRASVNSFGFGGANAHIILESAPVFLQPKEQAKRAVAKLNLFPFSANCEYSLKANIEAHTSAETLQGKNLADIAHTLATRRSTFFHRGVAIISTEDAVPSLREMVTGKESSSQMKIGFIFSGQGAQWPQMGKRLLELYPRFDAVITELDSILSTLPVKPEWTIRATMLDETPTTIHQASRSQTVCTAVQLGLTVLLHDWNILPVGVVGHSSGEIAAAFSAGKITLSQAIIAAYYRGNAISRHPHEGAMLAVGLSVDQVQQYLVEGVDVACVNSPKSVTLSGSAPAVVALQKSLDGMNIFARVLKTDGNAYHSSFMKPIGEDYEALLSPFCEKNENDAAAPQAVMVSSVTGSVVEETHLPASYWRNNLENRVRFSDALEGLLKTKPEVNMLVEIGPHAVLKSVVTDVTRGVSRSDIQYESVMLRGGNQDTNLMASVGRLWIAGYPVNIPAVNQIDETTKSQVVGDLPRYNWNYSTLYWREPRISAAKRNLEYPRHALLGSLEIGACAGDRRVWRNVLRTADLPWLADHKIEEKVIFPASGYISMAVAALSQISRVVEKSKARKVTLQNIIFKQFLEVDPEHGAELIFTAHPEAKERVHGHSKAVYRLYASALNTETGEWSETFEATGLLTPETEEAPVAPPVELESSRLRLRGDDRLWYDLFAKFGLNFGPAFKSFRDLKGNVDLTQASCTFKPQSDSEEYGYMHPVTIDGAFQLCRLAEISGDVRKMIARGIPSKIGEIVVQLDSLNGGVGFEGRAIVRDPELPGALPHGQLLQEGVPVLAIRDLLVKNAVSASDSAHVGDRYPYMKSIWKPDVRALSKEACRAMFPSGDETPGAFERVSKNTELYFRLGAIAIQIGRRKYQGVEYTPPTESPHLKQFVEWMLQFKAPADLVAMSDEELQKEYDNIWAQCSFVEAETIDWVHKNLDKVLEGETTIHASEFESQLMSRLYHEGQWHQAGNTQIANLVDLLAHQDPTMNILEIGAGTGSLTVLLLEKLCGGRPLRQFENYVFTDIGQSFLTAAQKKWADIEGMDYKILDMTQDIQAQGFTEGTFDLLVAANVMHVTSPLIPALENVRRLLKPGGRLLLLESSFGDLEDQSPLPLFLGMTKDWWLGQADGRMNGLFQNLDDWRKDLQAAGFSDLELLLNDFPAPAGTTNVILVKRMEEETANDTPKSIGSDSSWDAVKRSEVEPVQEKETIYLVHRDGEKDKSEELSVELQKLLEDRKHKTIRIPLLADQMSNLPASARVIALIDVDAPFFTTEITPDEWLALQTMMSTATRLLWLTTGNLLDATKTRPDFGIAVGWCRSIRIEHPALKIRTLDIDDTTENRANLVVDLEHAFTTTDLYEMDNDFAYNGGVLHVSRMHEQVQLNNEFMGRFLKPTRRDQEIPLDEAGPVHLAFDKPGILDSVYFTKSGNITKSIGDDEVEVQVKAMGVSMKGVLSMLGRFAGDGYGAEGAGIVTRVGSGVTDIRPGQAIVFLMGCKLDTVIRLPQEHCVVYDENKYTFEQMASMPTLFPAVIHSFFNQARLSSTDTILIHSAAGGLGIAGIQLAQSIGATIYATVGSDEKRGFLTKTFGIPDSHIFNSRGGFKEQLFKATNGRGADVVMNTLNGPQMHESLACCAPMGRFLELGMGDIFASATIDLSLLDRSISILPFSLTHLFEYNGAGALHKLLKEMMVLLGSGSIRPIDAITCFDISKMTDAFRYFMQPTHIGKVVITYQDPKSLIKVRDSEPGVVLKDNATYMIIGGLGGLGKSMMTWLAKRGAKHLLVLSRSGKPSPENAEWIEELESTTDAKVHTAKCDVSKPADVERTRAFVDENLPPVHGIIHSAMCLRDHIFQQMPVEDFTAVLDPKVSGTQNVWSSFSSSPIDFFVICSSMAPIVGTATQSNYCAANAFQDAFAAHHRSLGAPIISLNIGMVGEVGYIAENTSVGDALLRNGIHMMYEFEFHHLLEIGLRFAPQSAGSLANLVTGLEPERLRELWQKGYGGGSRWTEDRRVAAIISSATRSSDGGAHLHPDQGGSEIKSLAKALGPDGTLEDLVQSILEKIAVLLLIKAENIDPRKAPVDYGIDSMVGAELRHWLFATLKTDVTFKDLLSPDTKILGLAEKCWGLLKA